MKVSGPGVVTGRSGSIGNVFFVENDFWPLNTTLYVKDFFGNDERFIFLLLQSLNLERFASGTGVPTLNRNHVSDELVCVPDCIEEQRRIVAVLDEAFAAIATATANAEKNLANARELFESILGAALSELDGAETSLGDATNIKVGFAFKSGGYTSQSDGIRLIRGDNIVQGRFRWEDTKLWPRTGAAEYGAYQLEIGDVLLAMDRTWVKAGLKYAVVGPDDVPSLLVQRVARLRATAITSSEYIALQIGSPDFTKYVLQIQTGLGVPHISGKQIADFRFVLPSPAQQDKIVRSVQAAKESYERLTQSYESKLLKLISLKQSLLRRAFSGELTTSALNSIAA